MNLTAAQSLVAWLWNAQPEIVYALSRRVPGALGQCFSCDLDLFTGSSSCDSSLFSSLSCAGISTDPSSLDPANLSSVNSCGLDSGLSCIQTVSESDLTPVDTSAVTGSCNTSFVGCSGNTSAASTDAATSNGLSGVANFLTSSAGLTALAKVAAAYFASQAASSAAAAAAAKAQAAVVSAQTARAAAGKTALPVTYVANGATGGTTAMISTTAGLTPLTSATLAALTPSSLEVFFAQYGTWMLVGGAAAFLVYAATRRRRT
jgi:hypothetical protein